jgi:transcriptional regulator with GAF, ATPase, and Fis domain
MNDEASKPESLEEAHRRIDAQAQRIAELEAEQDDENLARELRETLTQAAATGTIGSPVKLDRLLELLLETAAKMVGASAGAILVVDHRMDTMRCDAAIGPFAEKMRDQRIPLGEGVSSTVAMSGQALAIADAAHDQRVQREVEGTGYQPNSLICVPLFMLDHTIGAMELLDKGDAESFLPADLETLAEFATLVGLAIELGRTYRHIGPMLADVLQSGGISGDRASALRERSQTFAVHVELEPTYLATMELATLVQEIAWAGEDERTACIQILSAFQTYLRSKPDPFGEIAAL